MKICPFQIADLLALNSKMPLRFHAAPWRDRCVLAQLVTPHIDPCLEAYGLGRVSAPNLSIGFSVGVVGRAKASLVQNPQAWKQRDEHHHYQAWQERRQGEGCLHDAFLATEHLVRARRHVNEPMQDNAGPQRS